MAHPTTCPWLHYISPPDRQITRILEALCPIDRVYVRNIVGDLPLLAECPNDWTFLRFAIELWDPQHDPLVPQRFDSHRLAHVVLQVVGGSSYMEALVSETVRSLDYRKASRRDRMRGSPYLLSSWRRTYTRTILVERSLGPRRSDDHRVSGDHRASPHQSLRKHTHLPWPSNQTTRRPARHYRRGKSHCLLVHVGNPAPSVAKRFLRVREGLRPTSRPRAAPVPRVPPAHATNPEDTAQTATRRELLVIREERDRLRHELVEARAEHTDQRELQRELAEARVRMESLDREIARLSATPDRTQVRAREASHP
ncbi:hypothetical protein CRG98_028527 [Punica granatum]|uniref:Uncharacterized protein n=1 Tax=Punica granatum TaxID=22663 RepID=A0A2I0J4E4_PUNGR|nr:hypothetical protein CRG98_028527 [Punica granatum]